MKTKNIRNTIISYLLGIVFLGIILFLSSSLLKASTAESKNVMTEIKQKSASKNDIYFGARGAYRYNKGISKKNVFGKVDSKYAGTRSWWPSISRADEYVPSSTKNIYKTVTLGNTKAKKKILLLGDSHMIQYKYLFDIIGKKSKIKVISATVKWAGGNFYKISDKFGKTYIAPNGATLHVNYANKRFNYIKKEIIPKVDQVIISVRGNPLQIGVAERARNNKETISNIISTLKYIRKKTGNYPILIQDSPEDTVKLTEERLSLLKDIVIKKNPWKDTLKNRIEEESKEKKLFNYLITNSLFYDKKGEGHSYIGGLPVFRNSNHVSIPYALSCFEYFKSEVLRLMQKKYNK